MPNSLTTAPRIEIPESRDSGRKDGVNVILVVLEVGRCAVGRFDGPPSLLNPLIFIIHPNLCNGSMEDIAVVDNRHRDSLRAVCRCYDAAVAVTLLLEILVRLKVNVTKGRRIGDDYASPILSCRRKPRNRRKKCSGEQHYSTGPRSRATLSPALMIPRLEARMKLRILSLSSLGGKLCSTCAHPSATL